LRNGSVERHASIEYRGPRPRLWRWEGLLPVLVLSVTFPMLGCGHEASLTRETPTGGLVTWSVQSDGDILSSAGRRDALRLIKEKCPEGSRVVREGEVPKVSQTADRHWRGQMGTDRIWGIQFTCE
jgi:hypothetical protein